MSSHPEDTPIEGSDVFATRPASEEGLENTRQLDTQPDALEHHTEHEAPPAPPELGKYAINGFIGRGGMGVVWKGFDPDLQRTVAIKVLGEHLAHSPTSRRRFQREGRAAAAISHPNVVTVHAVEEHLGVPYLVMEYVSGGSLKEYVIRCGKLDPIEVIRLSCQIAQGLAAAHLQGVIHRDVKPGNVMLHEGASRARLTDFGLARVAYDNVELTSHDQIIGTPAYTSPEQIQGPRVDARADLFSLGCVMFYMLTGQSPWQGRTQAETIHRIATATPPRLHDLNPSIPQALSDIVERLLQKNPDDRYQSAFEVADILRRFLRELNQSPTDELLDVPGSQKVEPASARPRRSRMVAACLGVGLLLGAFAFAAWGLPWLGLAPRQGTLDKLTSITVGPGDGADCRTIGEAVNLAAENCTITVTGPGPYDEAVKLQGSSVRGLRLRARPRAVWRTSENEAAPALTVSHITDVAVDGFDFHVPTEAGLRSGRLGRDRLVVDCRL